MLTQHTLGTFGHPATVVKEYAHWWVLCGKSQMTLGTLIVIAKDGATTLSDVSDATFAELPRVIRAVESALTPLFQAERFNYLWLMMATREAHAAIIPRYSGERAFGGMTFTDPGWPKKPNLDFTHSVPPEIFMQLVETLRQAFNTSL